MSDRVLERCVTLSTRMCIRRSIWLLEVSIISMCVTMRIRISMGMSRRLSMRITRITRMRVSLSSRMCPSIRLIQRIIRICGIRSRL